MKLYKDILLLLTLTGLLWSAVGCSGVIYDNYSAENDPEDPNLVTLVLNVGLVSPTRAVDVDNDREAMHSLRIVLLDAEGKVEYNEHIGFERGETEYSEGVSGYQFIRTTLGKKKIFLIANEEWTGPIGGVTGFPELTSLLNSKGLGAEGFEDMVKSVYFTPGNYSKYIPLSSSYEFTISETDFKAGTSRVEKEFYLVHAATKFEFEFINNRNNAVDVTALSLSYIASDMYLMAHFDKQAAEEKNVEWVDALGKPRKEYWIDWLKEVSEKTTDNPNDTDDPQTDNETINAGYGWIKDYVSPSLATEHYEKVLIEGSKFVVDDYLVPSDEFITIPTTATSANPYRIPVVYSPESKYIPSDGTDQQYSFSITLKDITLDSEQKFDIPLSYIAAGQENLVTLFRNTSVRVKIALYGYTQLQVFVMLTAWDEQTSGDITFS